MLIVASRGVKRTILVAGLAVAGSGVAAQQAAPIDPAVEIGAKAVELFDAESPHGRGLQAWGSFSKLRQMNEKANQGEIGEAYGIGAGAVVSWKGTERILALLKTPAFRSLGRMCSRHPVEMMVCVAVFTYAAIKLDSVIEEKLKEAGKSLQHDPVPGQATPVGIRPTPTPNPVLKRASPILGKWTFYERQGDRQIAFMSPVSEFEPLFALRCEARSATISVHADLPDSLGSGRSYSVRLMRGRASLTITGTAENGPTGLALGTEATLPQIAVLGSEPGPLLLAFPNGEVWSMTEANLSSVYSRFLKGCASAPTRVASAGAGTCLTYKGPVTMTGHVQRRVYPGPPNYDSVARGDRAETVLLLSLPTPACVAADPTDPDGQSPGIARLPEVQLGDGSGALANAVGTRVTVSGRLYGAHTGHHRTPVVLGGVQVATAGRNAD